jgi:hypothetical protein
MPERPGSPPPSRPPDARARAEAERLRAILRKAPPLPATAPPFPAEPPLDAGLADLAPWWLETRCTCGHVAFLPLRRLAAERGRRTPLRAILPRLRCRACRAPPARVDFIANPADQAVGAGGGSGHRVALVGAGGADGPRDIVVASQE